MCLVTGPALCARTHTHTHTPADRHMRGAMEGDPRRRLAAQKGWELWRARLAGLCPTTPRTQTGKMQALLQHASFRVPTSGALPALQVDRQPAQPALATRGTLAWLGPSLAQRCAEEVPAQDMHLGSFHGPTRPYRKSKTPRSLGGAKRSTCTRR